MGAGPWAILDFVDPNGRTRREVFREPITVLTTRALGEVRGILDEVEAMAGAGHHLVGFVAYDAAPAFEPRFELRAGYAGPLVWFAAFNHRTAESLPAFPAEAESENWRALVDRADYRRAVGEIIDGITRGDFYQVNLTARFESEVQDAEDLYERLKGAQQQGYFAYIDTGDMQVVSVSPELFVRRSGSVLESRPMKGTASRGRWTAEDDALAAQLESSEKDRAENVMIVDLIRNDMGRIAIPGTVEVPSMFTVERYPTVLQMTSHVRSEIPADTSLASVFTALFPCGSITGAPKIAASKSIALLEAEPRGLYCGAIGVVRPGVDFVFNVAIRTLTVTQGHAVYGAGGGITADSNPLRELDELFSKAAVLTARPETFGLIETMRLEDRKILRLDRHLRRLAGSARYFGFELESLTGVEDSLLRAADEWAPLPHRIRVLLNRDGSHELSGSPYLDAAGPRRVGLARTPVHSQDRLLYHKVSDRSRYSAIVAELSGIDDAVLINERGEITETTIGNLVLELEGAFVTPALSCGLLPGILREELLEEGRIAERVLYPADLARCTRFWMINSLRGWVACELR